MALPRNILGQDSVQDLRYYNASVGCYREKVLCIALPKSLISDNHMARWNKHAFLFQAISQICTLRTHFMSGLFHVMIVFIKQNIQSYEFDQTIYEPLYSYNNDYTVRSAFTVISSKVFNFIWAFLQRQNYFKALSFKDLMGICMSLGQKGRINFLKHVFNKCWFVSFIRTSHRWSLYFPCYTLHIEGKWPVIKCQAVICQPPHIMWSDLSWVKEARHCCNQW